MGLAALLGFASCTDPATAPEAEKAIGARRGIPTPIRSNPSDVVTALARAYNERDKARLAGLLANQPDARYLFIGSNALWDKNEEERIASRMFEPDQVPPSEPPVDPALWLVSLQVQFKQISPWEERVDLYRSATNPDGLDPAHWRAVGAPFAAFARLETQGDTDFRIDVPQNFVVIEDLTNPWGPAPASYLYRWAEAVFALRGETLAAEPTTWAQAKSLYR